jgi:hypothetical protein
MAIQVNPDDPHKSKRGRRSLGYYCLKHGQEKLKALRSRKPRRKA